MGQEDRYEDARRRLRLMMDARTPSPQTGNLHRDLEILQAMLLLLKGAQDIRAMQSGLGTSYEESKQLVYTLIETKPKFTRAKAGALADTVGQLVTSAVPRLSPLRIPPHGLALPLARLVL